MDDLIKKIEEEKRKTQNSSDKNTDELVVTHIYIWLAKKLRIQDQLTGGHTEVGSRSELGAWWWKGCP